MSLPSPEREITSRPKCDAPVQGDGVMSYHCSLPVDHEQNTLDKTDPQPCYAVESGRSRRMWGQWKRREDERQEDLNQPEQTLIDCPSCKVKSMVIDYDAQMGTCENCGAKVPFQQEVHHPSPVSIEEAEQPGQPWKVLEADHTLADFHCKMRLGDDTMAGSEKERCPVCRPLTPEEMDAILRGERPEGVPDIPGITVPLTGITNLEPTKQREGDQRLPAGGDRVVQQWVIKQAEDAYVRGEITDENTRFIKQAMLESIRVGTERYGQPLKTYDGRLNIKDLAEELRDAYVYVSKLQMTAEADRATLVRVVSAALSHWDEEYDDRITDHGYNRIAEVAVDRILDWVLTQKIGPEQVLPVVEGAQS